MERVWRWKEEVAGETEHMTAAERIAYFRDAQKRLEAKTGRKIELARVKKKRG
jgi:hypothetical protein